MSDWGDEALDEWMRTAAAHTGERLNAMDDGPLNRAGGKDNLQEEDNVPDPEGDEAISSGDGKGDADAIVQLDDADVNDEIRPVPVFGVLSEPESSDTAPKRGRWEVITEASRYQLDLDRELLRRIRGTVKPGPDVAFPAKLRDHDRGWVRLLRIIQLEVGKPAVFDIESLGGLDVAYTRRTTTWVVSIRQLGESETFR